MTSSKINNEMAIIIPACDEYIDVLTQFIKYFKLFWKNCPFEIIIVTQSNLTSYNDVSSYISKPNAQWLERVIEGLKHTRSKYILTMMEDAFISKPVKNSEILEILDFMRNNKVVYYRNPKKTYKEIKNDDKYSKDYRWASKVKKNVSYSVSCFTDIWDRDELVRLLDAGLYSGWDIENYYLINSSRNATGYYEGYASDIRNFLNVIEVVNQGQWTYEVKKFNKIGFPVDIGHRKKAPLKIYYKRKMHSFFNKITPRKFRKTIKNVLSKFGYKFVSKN